MKNFCIVLIALTITTGSIAQTKKKLTHGHAVKKAAAASAAVVKEKEPESPLTVDNAGRYAKAFANKMYYTTPVYGDKMRGLNVQIKNWKSLQSDDGTWFYFIKLDLTWQEGTGGWGDWKDTKYSGVLVTDQFGCNVLYLIDERVEPSLFGMLKRARKLPDDQREKIAAKDEWTANVQYIWEPEGCLE
jgi:hypothetical protein